MRLLLIGILTLTSLTFSSGQTIMNKKIVYETKIKYRRTNPDLITYPIDKSTTREIIEIATNGQRSDSEIDSIQSIIWNAMTNPLEFDSLFKDFSNKTLGSGYSQKSDGTIIKEPKPFLAEWSVAYSELTYYQFVINFILTEFHAISYGDDGDGVQAAFSQILQTRKINIGGAKFNGGVYSYLKDINEAVLRNYDKIALVIKGDFTIFVCKKNEQNRLIELTRKINWTLVEP